MSLHLITGYAGQNHITAADNASFNIAMFGDGEFVLDRGNKFKAEIISNNLIRILDGDLMIQGRHVRLAENTYEELVIENGTQGMYRNDLIVARYEKDATTGIEKCKFVVLKGEANATSGKEPNYTTGDITEAGNALVTEFPLYRITLNGLNIESVTKLFTIGETLQSVKDELKGTLGYTKKQLITYPFKYSNISSNGITFTVNSDGTVTANGTATSDATFNVFQRFDYPLTLKKGNYILNGSPKCDNNEYSISITKPNGDKVYDFGNGSIFDLEEESNLSLTLFVANGETVNNLTFKPMIRYASIQDDTYEPYVADVLTRLTDKKGYNITFNGTYVGGVALSAIVKKNGWAMCKFQFKITSNVKADTTYTIGTLPNELIPFGSNNVFPLLDGGASRSSDIYGELHLNQNTSNITLIVRGTPNTGRWYHGTFSYPLLND